MTRHSCAAVGALKEWHPADARIQVKHAPGEIVDFVPWARTGGVEGKPVGPEWVGKVNLS